METESEMDRKEIRKQQVEENEITQRRKVERERNKKVKNTKAFPALVFIFTNISNKKMGSEDVTFSCLKYL